MCERLLLLAVGDWAERRFDSVILKCSISLKSSSQSARPASMRSKQQHERIGRRASDILKPAALETSNVASSRLVLGAFLMLEYLSSHTRTLRSRGL